MVEIRYALTFCNRFEVQSAQSVCGLAENCWEQGKLELYSNIQMPKRTKTLFFNKVGEEKKFVGQLKAGDK